jgi:hypothetical protein
MGIARRFVAVASTGLLLALLLPEPSGAVSSEIVDRWQASKRSVSVPIAAGKGPGAPSAIECSVAAAAPGDLNLDCDDPFPNNEPDIEVDPTDPDHVIASSNDFGTCCDQFYTSFDGGLSWETGNMSNSGPTRIGSDPVTVFDVKNGTAIHPSLSFTVSAAGACDGDLVVSVSTDGGLTWDVPVLVADGDGCDLSANQLFHDKEWVVTDNNPASPFYGRTYLTWTAFRFKKAVYQSSAIFESHSDDGGFTWTAPQEISGSNPAICTFQETGPAGVCDEDQFSVPTVGSDGTVFVAFQNFQNEATWEPGDLFESQYLVVRSADGGATWSNPTFVVALEDGTTDYPLNVSGRQTLSGYQVRVNSAGNIVADPTNGRLYLVFSDNRAGVHDVASPITNTNVFLMTSRDGVRWSGPTLVDPSTTDQWFPWVEVNPVDGTIGIVYHTRLASNPDLYDTVLVEGKPRALKTTFTTSAPSDPTDSIFFRAGVAGCEDCATFHGDYNNLSYGIDGVAHVAWTDMRDFDATLSGFRQFIYYRSV